MEFIEAKSMKTEKPYLETQFEIDTVSPVLEKLADLEEKIDANAKPVDEKEDILRTMKVTTDVLEKILAKAGVKKGNNADATDLSKLIAYLTGFSSNTIRQRFSNKEELTSAHSQEIKNINQLLKKLNLEIVIDYNKYR